MSYTTLILEKINKVAKVILNRPERLNAINAQMGEELLRLCDELEGDDEVRAIILTGAGRAFSAGGDVQDILLTATSLDAKRREELIRLFDQVTLRIMRLEKPLIAAVNGVAVGGGCCLAMCCDIRLAADIARFGVVFIHRGLSGADMGATWLLPRIVGLGKAAELLLTGDIIDAQEAQRIGLVNKVVPLEKLEEEASTLASRLATAAPLGIKMTKRALLRTFTSDLASQLEFEASVQTFCFGTKDIEEGIRSFLEKREPMFEGK